MQILQLMLCFRKREIAKKNFDGRKEKGRKGFDAAKVDWMKDISEQKNKLKKERASYLEKGDKLNNERNKESERTGVEWSEMI
jgi:hypothetical protein